MRRLLIKISVSFIILCISAVIFAGCNILSGFCTHDSVKWGTCQSPDICNICGKVVGEYGDHDYTVTAVPPSCTADGRNEYTCRYCDDSYSILGTPTTGHSFGEWMVTVHPTAISKGEKVRYCTLCDIADTASISAHEHNMVKAEARAPECENDGWDEYEYCSLCEYSTRTLIAALGHDYGDYISIGNGLHERVCATDSAHTETSHCTGGSTLGNSLPVCDYCGGEYDLVLRYGNSSYGYYAFAEYPRGEHMQSLYRDLTAAAECFFTSDEDLTSEGGYYIIDGFDISAYGLSLEEAKAVWKIFYVSTPAYYWLDASIVTSGDIVYLAVADDYASASFRHRCDEEIERMTRECEALISDGMSTLERAVVITEYIVTRMEYAYEADGVTPVADMWAHNMAGLAVHGYGVCEAYAKSFMYLCLRNGVECIMGSGYAGGEAHAWNYFKLGESWYGADLTWTDKLGDVAVYDCFGLSSGAIFKDHTSHSSSELGVNFIYETPKLSTTDLELTALYENGGYVGLYGSIAEAFDKMDDSQGEYEIYIGFYSYFENTMSHTMTNTVTPSVKKLTIRGNSEFVGDGYLDNNSTVNVMKSLKLGSDIVLVDVQLMSVNSSGQISIDLVRYELTLQGKSVYIEPRILGSGSTCKITASTERGAYMIGGVDVYRLVVKKDKAIMGADSVIQYGNTAGIYTLNGVNVVIKHKDRQ